MVIGLVIQRYLFKTINYWLEFSETGIHHVSNDVHTPLVQMLISDYAHHKMAAQCIEMINLLILSTNTLRF